MAKFVSAAIALGSVALLAGCSRPRLESGRLGPMARVIAWVSAGAASAIAGKLAQAKYGERVVFAYCETGGEHPDNERFLADLVRWYDAPIERLRNTKYASTWEVWEDRGYLAGIDGAPCTGLLKIEPRVAFQRPGDVHVFGYTAEDRKSVV